MKKLLATAVLSTFVIALGPLHAAAHKTDKALPAFDVDDNTFGIAVGLNPTQPYYHPSYGSKSVDLPAIILNFEHGVFNAGPGTLGIGAEFGCQISYPDYGENSIRDYHTALSLLLRGTYHLTVLKGRQGVKFDPYAGFAIGFSDRAEQGAVTYVAPFVGMKYNLTPHFGVWTELGSDVAAWKLGVNSNF
jgi:hypothetical protein